MDLPSIVALLPTPTASQPGGTADQHLERKRRMGRTDPTVTDLGMVEGFDVGLEMSGNPAAFRDLLRTMHHGGSVALLGIPPGDTAIDWNQVIFKGLVLKGVYGREMFETWYKMSAMLQSGLDISKDPLALQRLDEAAEKAKHELSTTMETEINIPFITSDSSGPKHLLMKLSRATLEELAREYIDRSIAITKQVLESAKMASKDIQEIVMVGGQTRMPAINEAVKALFGKEPNHSINPDEVVADGAAIQAGIMQGDVKDVLLLDVIPLSLGIETMGGVATKIIERNTTIPASKSQVFSTASDSQTSVEIHIVQGERAMANDNKTLGRFHLEGIPPAPRGMPQIEVSFDVDANGILSVKAKDKATNKEQSVRIEARSGLSESDIEKMKADADVHADADKAARELVETRNLADTTLYTAEKALKDHADKITDDVKASVQSAIDALKSVKDNGDKSAIESATAVLTTEMQKIGQAMNQPQQPPTDGATPESAGPEAQS